MKRLHPTRLNSVLDELISLREEILARSASRLTLINYNWPQKDRDYSALNLSLYLAFRQHDIRPLQKKLSKLGLSSLGRGEADILKNIDRVIRLLTLAVDVKNTLHLPTPNKTDNFDDVDLLKERNNLLFGQSADSYTRVMVTLPLESEINSDFIANLMSAGMDCARINCAHGDNESWHSAVEAIAQANREFENQPCKIFMDLAGLKIRTIVNSGIKKQRMHIGDVFKLQYQKQEEIPVESKDNKIVGCSSDIFLTTIKQGQSVWIDDGKLGAVVEKKFSGGVKLRVTHAGPNGVQIKNNKGINFPDTRLDCPTLTDKDIVDMDFVCANADIIGVSFVQSELDVELVVGEITKRGRLLPLVAKIETRQAVEKLPEILFRGLAYEGSFGIMIARGDLAVELGSVRMAEIQEEILWLCEAAHVPVIWATQVLESLAKNGIVSRPEITDAAMAVRAECVMLNKGKYIVNAVKILREILNRMGAHQHKKVSRLRALHW